MANRRMFSKSVVCADAFFDLPGTARLLYFALGMEADDDGFLGSARRTMRDCEADESDLQALIDAGYLFRFKSGVVLLVHWRTNNQLRTDRHVQTVHRRESAQVEFDPECMVYRWLPDGEPVVTADKGSSGKDSLGEDRGKGIGVATAPPAPAPDPPAKPKRQAFKVPTLEDVRSYCQERRNQVDPQRFIDFYEANGWRVGRNPMKSWQAAVRTWESRGEDARGQPARAAPKPFDPFSIPNTPDRYAPRDDDFGAEFMARLEAKRNGKT